MNYSQTLTRAKTLLQQKHIKATGEVDANLVDLSVKESVVQFNPQGKVEAE